MFRASFNYRQISDVIKSIVFFCPFPPLEGGTLFQLSHLIHHELPSPPANVLVACCNVCSRDLKIYGGLKDRFIFRVYETFCRGPVLRKEARLLFCEGVFSVEGASTEEQRETFFHMHELVRAS